MPIYCISKIKVSSKDKDELKRFKKEVLDDGFDFEKIIPYPIGAPLEAKEEFEKKDDVSYKNEWTQWYKDNKIWEWCSKAWGTKWNREDIGLKIVEQKNGFFKIEFTNAWNPPYGIYMRLRNRYPNLNIKWIYYEEEDGFKQGYILDDKEAIEYDEATINLHEDIKNGNFTLTLKERN
tara:strand:+ start:116 stop:649 length:534 start_codon:yes stop_codon:yes gene_type:complete